MGHELRSEATEVNRLSLLLALCGDDKRNLKVKRVPLSEPAREDVRAAFSQQEEVFRAGEEMPFDENWLNDGAQIATAPIPEDVPVFGEILRSTDTSLSPIDTDNLDEVRGLAIKSADRRRERILVQVFANSQHLSRDVLVALFLERGAYTRLESSAFRLDDKLVCIVEGDLIKFRSLHNLSRVIETSTIFATATDSEVSSFATDYSNLFEIAAIDRFVAGMSRNARKYMTSLARSGVLRNRTAQELHRAADGTGLAIEVRDGRIVMPSKSGDITELMRFLNDGRYVGPVSGDAFITNSRRPAT